MRKLLIHCKAHQKKQREYLCKTWAQLIGVAERSQWLNLRGKALPGKFHIAEGGEIRRSVSERFFSSGKETRGIIPSLCAEADKCTPRSEMFYSYSYTDRTLSFHPAPKSKPTLSSSEVWSPEGWCSFWLDLSKSCPGSALLPQMPLLAQNPLSPAERRRTNGRRAVLGTKSLD